MKCITCGENEAINDFYKECVDCIEKYRQIKEMNYRYFDFDTKEYSWGKDYDLGKESKEMS